MLPATAQKVAPLSRWMMGGATWWHLNNRVVVCEGDGHFGTTVWYVLQYGMLVYDMVWYGYYGMLLECNGRVFRQIVVTVSSISDTVHYLSLVHFTNHIYFGST